MRTWSWKRAKGQLTRDLFAQKEKRPGRTDEKDETAVDFLCSELVTLAGQFKRGLGPLFSCTPSRGGTQCPIEGLSPLEAVERLGEGTAISREVVPLDEPHAEGKERVVVIHDPEEVARVPLGKDLSRRRLSEKKWGRGGAWLANRTGAEGAGTDREDISDDGAQQIAQLVCTQLSEPGSAWVCIQSGGSGVGLTLSGEFKDGGPRRVCHCAAGRSFIVHLDEFARQSCLRSARDGTGN